MIAARSLGVRAGGRALLQDVSIALPAGHVVAVVGPNGAGKSTLFRALTGERRPDCGSVTLDGKPLAQWHPAALARRRGVVSQHGSLAFPLTVAEVVALGRMPWHGTTGTARDREAIARAMASAGIAHLAAQDHATLSGGERQRVQLARALAQIDGATEPAALLLDEPTASLDVRHGAALLRLLRRLAAQGTAILVVLHDLNEAMFVADSVAVLVDGRCIAEDAAAKVLRPDLLRDAYGVSFTVAPGMILPDFGAREGA